MSTAAAVPLARAPSRSPTAILVGKLFRRKLVLAGAAILVLVALLALFAPWVTPYDPMAMKISDRIQSRDSRTGSAPTSGPRRVLARGVRRALLADDRRIGGADLGDGRRAPGTRRRILSAGSTGRSCAWSTR
jgi:peptide/nickel transport system permease protein